MTSILRNDLAPLGKRLMDGATCSNAGLALDLYQPFTTRSGSGELSNAGITRNSASETPLTRFFDQVCATPLPETYRLAVADWRSMLEKLPGTRATPATASSRIVVGLGAETIRETGISLMQPYGVPYLTAEALKGLARSYCERAIERLAGDDPNRADAVLLRDCVFGSPKSASLFTFYDAWLVPGHEKAIPLHRDVITIHHPDYYNARGEDARRSPLDLDDPTPIPFLSASGTYLLAVRGPDDDGEWAQQVLDVLTSALADWGIGAKTSSGYGVFLSNAIAAGAAPPTPARKPEAIEAGAKLIEQINKITPGSATAVGKDKKPHIRVLCEQATKLTDHQMRIDAQRAVLRKLLEIGKIDEWRQHQWVVQLQHFLQRHGGA